MNAIQHCVYSTNVARLFSLPLAVCTIYTTLARSLGVCVFVFVNISMLSVYRCHCCTNTHSYSQLHSMRVETRSTHGEQKSSISIPTRMPTISFITVHCRRRPFCVWAYVCIHTKEYTMLWAIENPLMLPACWLWLWGGYGRPNIYAANGNLNPFAFAFIDTYIAFRNDVLFFEMSMAFTVRALLCVSYRNISVFHHIKCTVCVYACVGTRLFEFVNVCARKRIQ